MYKIDAIPKVDTARTARLHSVKTQEKCHWLYVVDIERIVLAGWRCFGYGKEKLVSVRQLLLISLCTNVNEKKLRDYFYLQGDYNHLYTTRAWKLSLLASASTNNDEHLYRLINNDTYFNYISNLLLDYWDLISYIGPTLNISHHLRINRYCVALSLGAEHTQKRTISIRIHNINQTDNQLLARISVSLSTGVIAVLIRRLRTHIRQSAQKECLSNEMN